MYALVKLSALVGSQIFGPSSVIYYSYTLTCASTTILWFYHMIRKNVDKLWNISLSFPLLPSNILKKVSKHISSKHINILASLRGHRAIFLWKILLLLKYLIFLYWNVFNKKFFVRTAWNIDFGNPWFFENI